MFLWKFSTLPLRTDSDISSARNRKVDTILFHPYSTIKRSGGLIFLIVILLMNCKRRETGAAYTKYALHSSFLGCEKTHENFSSSVGFLTKIRDGHLVNTSQKHYCLNLLIRWHQFPSDLPAQATCSLPTQNGVWNRHLVCPFKDLFGQIKTQHRKVRMYTHPPERDLHPKSRYQNSAVPRGPCDIADRDVTETDWPSRMYHSAVGRNSTTVLNLNHRYEKNKSWFRKLQHED